jgi:hypothetical protein
MTTRLGPEPVVASTAEIEESRLGAYVEIGDRTRISHSRFGDYSYMMEDGQVLFSSIGKFCSIASSTISPTAPSIISKAAITTRASSPGGARMR